MELTIPRPNWLQEQCTSLVALWITVLEATIWALDDGRQNPRRIVARACAILNERHSELYLTIARRDKKLAEDACLRFWFFVQAGEQLRPCITTKQLDWWESRLPGYWSSTETSEQARKALLKSLHFESRRDDSADDSADLHSDAICHVEQHFKQGQIEALSDVPERVEFIPLQTSTGIPIALNRERWGFWPSERNKIFTIFLGETISLFSGFDPARIARTSHRNARDTAEAKKRGRSGGRHARRYAKAHGEEEPRTAILEDVQDDRLVLPPVNDSPELCAIAAQSAARLFQLAQRNWGEKGERFVRALQEGDVIEASEVAGISSATGYRWREELYREVKRQ
jgi:hypothetical protein